MPLGNKSIARDVRGRSTYTLPRLGFYTVCIHDQKSKVAESVEIAAGVVICWPDVVFEELIDLLYGTVEEWHSWTSSSGYIRFYLLDNVCR